MLTAINMGAVVILLGIPALVWIYGGPESSALGKSIFQILAVILATVFLYEILMQL